MTREETLRETFKQYNVPTSNPFFFAVLDVLKQESCEDTSSSEKPNNCEDAISREAVLEPYKTLNDKDTIPIWLLRKDIEHLPSVTPRQRMGRWVLTKIGKLFPSNPSNEYKCSECGKLLDFDGVDCGRGDANYCPNCGARMVEPQESEDKK